jgi:PPOX class probable F420-dependent enzyme
MVTLHPDARALLESDALVHLVTLNADGSPQLSGVWVGLDGDEIVSGHMLRRQKVRNVERDPRVVLSVEAQTHNPLGLREYLVIRGRARIQVGGAATCCSVSPTSISAPTCNSRRRSTRRPATCCASRPSRSAAWAPGPTVDAGQARVHTAPDV